MFANGTEHLTTTEIQQIIQREVDTCRNSGVEIAWMEIDYGAKDPLCIKVEDLAFFKGRFVVGRFADETKYIPVENVLSIGFNYNEDDDEDEDEEKE